MDAKTYDEAIWQYRQAVINQLFESSLEAEQWRADIAEHFGVDLDTVCFDCGER